MWSKRAIIETMVGISILAGISSCHLVVYKAKRTDETFPVEVELYGQPQTIDVRLLEISGNFMNFMNKSTTYFEYNGAKIEVRDKKEAGFDCPEDEATITFEDGEKRKIKLGYISDSKETITIRETSTPRERAYYQKYGLDYIMEVLDPIQKATINSRI